MLKLSIQPLEAAAFGTGFKAQITVTCSQYFILFCYHDKAAERASIAALLLNALLQCFLYSGISLIAATTLRCVLIIHAIATQTVIYSITRKRRVSPSRCYETYENVDHNWVD
jgi:hypothetical protein